MIVLVATARLDLTDAEMADRIARHRADRGRELRLLELWSPGTPDLPAVVAAAPAGTTLLVDSLETRISLLAKKVPAEWRALEVVGQAVN